MINSQLLSRPVVLVLLEGWGLSTFWVHNAIENTNPENFNYFWKSYPHLSLKTLNITFAKTGSSLVSLATGNIYKPYSKGFDGEKIYFHSKPSISKIISEHGFKQLKITEKIAAKNISEYFNAFEEKEYDGEKRVLIGNENIDIDRFPGMHIKKFPEILKEETKNQNYDFILIYIPNLDLLKNSDIETASKAVKEIDYCLKQIVDIVLSENGQVFITASCGGAEHIGYNKTEDKLDLFDYVPFIYVKIDNQKPTYINLSKEMVSQIINPLLSIDCIAPTILDSLLIKNNYKMTGKSLLDQL